MINLLSMAYKLEEAVRRNLSDIFVSIKFITLYLLESKTRKKYLDKEQPKGKE